MASQPKASARGPASNDWTSTPISLAQAGRACGRTSEWARRLINDGHLTPLPDQGGKAIVVTIGALLKAVAAHYAAVAAGASATAGAARVQNARAAEIELRMQERTRVLIPFAESVEAMTMFIGSATQEFQGLAKRVTRDVELQRRIDDEVHLLRNRIADHFARESEFARTGVRPSGGKKS